ncbi:hypothetical protein ACSU4I_05885 [Escherichia coli]
MSEYLDTKTSMIVYALEKALAAYVVSEDAGGKSRLSEHFEPRSKLELERGRGPVFNTQTLIQASYIGEIFNYALQLAKGTSDYDKLSELKEFCTAVDLFFIRNQISHPTRPFHEHYWHCAAAIASHPYIEVLGLKSVKDAYYSASTGQLKAPPEEWFSTISWEINNNLPDKFDHDITSLIGRKGEKKELLSAINNDRTPFIAVVAPGGVGKTALILDFLKELSISPKANEKFKNICYLTLKKHHLTADGISELKNIDTISEIKKEIVGFFNPDEEIENYDDLYSEIINDQDIESTLLCIDNLETLLRDGPDEFIRFQYTLPSNFKVVVTSRIMVDGAYPISLKELQSGVAFHLAKSYSDKRGIINLTPEELTRITEVTHFNPLAIRLTIDSIYNGMALPDSIEKSKKDIAAFSFNNLLDVLSNDAISILECLFVTGASSRSFLTHFLDSDPDSIAKAIKEILNTSLVSRKTSNTGEEEFSLSESIKELLITSPRNNTVRNIIAEKARKQRTEILHLQKFQQDKEIDRFDYRFIPNNSPDSLQIAVNRANKILGYKSVNKDKLNVIYEDFKTLAQIYQKNPLFMRTYARILHKQGDNLGAISCIKSAIDIESENPLNNLTLMYIYKDIGDFIEAQKVSQELIDSGFDRVEHSGEVLSSIIMREYLGVHLYGKEYPDILEYTEKWKDSHSPQEQAYFRVAALKRSCENNFDINPESVEKNISEVIDILEFIFEKENISDRLSDEAIKSLNLFCDTIKNNIDKLSQQFIIKVIDFAESNLADITKFSKDFKISSKEVVNIISTMRATKIPNNPFTSPKWSAFSSSKTIAEFEQITWENNGYSIAEIYSDLTLGKGFVFARDSDGKEILIHRDSCLGEEKYNWSNYIRGKTLAIKFVRTKKGHSATESHLIN